MGIRMQACACASAWCALLLLIAAVVCFSPLSCRRSSVCFVSVCVSLSDLIFDFSENANDALTLPHSHAAEQARARRQPERSADGRPVCAVEHDCSAPVGSSLVFALASRVQPPASQNRAACAAAADLASEHLSHHGERRARRDRGKSAEGNCTARCHRAAGE